MNELERKPPAADKWWVFSEVKHTMWLLNIAPEVCDVTLAAMIERWADEADL